MQDEPEKNLMTGLREIAKVHRGDLKLIADQHTTISNATDEELPEIRHLLAECKLDNLDHSSMRLSSSACVALQRCGMLRVFPGSYKNDVGGRCSVVFRAGHGWIRACACTVSSQ